MSKRRPSHGDASATKKAKSSPAAIPLHRDLLSLFYPNCTSLRAYVLASLPHSSRLRRRKIESIGSSEASSEAEKDIARLLDSSFVCYHQLTPHTSDNRWEQWLSFSQKGDDSNVTLSGGSSIYSQAEVGRNVPGATTTVTDLARLSTLSSGCSSREMTAEWRGLGIFCAMAIAGAPRTRRRQN